MPSTTLILGGARSGKSAYALEAAEGHTGDLLFIATARPLDEEMADRIAQHQAERGPRWRTVEGSVDLPGTIKRESAGAMLVDCLTLWLSNLMEGRHDLRAATEALIEVAAKPPVPLYLISNEVGSGIVPDNPLGRSFRDEAGRLNQAIARASADVRLIVAGLPVTLKGQNPSG